MYVSPVFPLKGSMANPTPERSAHTLQPEPALEHFKSLRTLNIRPFKIHLLQTIKQTNK